MEIDVAGQLENAAIPMGMAFSRGLRLEIGSTQHF